MPLTSIECNNEMQLAPRPEKETVGAAYPNKLAKIYC